jgi:hypothetical protein
MANDSISESFAIRVFMKRAEGESETPTEQNAVKTLERRFSAKGAEAVLVGAKDSPVADI